jgi:NADH dehydrogenase
VGHFVFLSPLGATPHHRSRLHRAKALAEQAVAAADLPTTTVRCSLIYARGDRTLTLLDRMSLLPAVPVTRRMGRARTQPVFAADVAAAVDALLTDPPERHRTVELAGPQTLTNREAVAAYLALRGRPRRQVVLPSRLIVAVLHAYEAATGPIAITTRDEADLLGATILAARGTADAEALGVRPRTLADALG